jgi:hypothetical protein
LKNFFLLHLLCLSVSCGIIAQEDSSKSFGLVLEEDFFWEFVRPQKNLDKDYTGGGILAFKEPWVQKLKLSAANKFFDQLTGTNRSAKNYGLLYSETFRLGLTVFTPEGKYLNIEDPLYGQRPYANFAFIGTTRSFLNQARGTALTTQLDIGVLGTYAGRELQAVIHSWYRKSNGLLPTDKPYDPAGWGNQVSRGGEPSLLYSVTYKKLLTTNDATMYTPVIHHFDASVSGGWNLGIYNSLTGTATARAGFIRMPWYQFNSFPVIEGAPLSPGEKKSAIDSTIKGRDAKRGISKGWRNAEAFLFLTIRPTIMIYNVPLQGQFKYSEVVFNAAEVSHLLNQLETGMVVSIGHLTLNATYIFRTRQYKGFYGRDHSYFSVGATWRTPYYK